MYLTLRFSICCHLCHEWFWLMVDDSLKILILTVLIIWHRKNILSLVVLVFWRSSLRKHVGAGSRMEASYAPVRLFLMASLATMICSRFASVCKSKINCWYTCWNQIFHPLFKRLKLRVYFAVRGPDIVGYNYILSSSIFMLLGNLISGTASFLKKNLQKSKNIILFSQKMRWF